MSSQVGLPSKIFKSRQILLDQLSYRGFDTTNYEAFSISQVQSMFLNDQLDMLLEKKDKSSKIYVKYIMNTVRIKTPLLDEVIEEIFQNEMILEPTDELLFIIRMEPNDTLKKFIKEKYFKDGLYVNIVNIQRYMFNILDHQLVPTHTILTDKQVEELKTEVNIKEITQLPEISRLDPVAITIGLRPNQVCKIERKSPTSLTSIYYRVCIW